MSAKDMIQHATNKDFVSFQKSFDGLLKQQIAAKRDEFLKARMSPKEQEQESD